MLKLLTALFVFLGGFAVMVLEIIGAPFLQKDFGSTYYIWVNQIGVILVALALGYSIGGALADKFKRVGMLAVPLAVAGFYTVWIPQLAQPLLDKLIMRHPAGVEIPELWVKLDPILGSAMVFFLPCFVLAILSPCMVRFAAHRLDRVGTVSGLIYAASTVGSIAGVFATGYFLLDRFNLTTIFRMTGGLILFLSVMSIFLDTKLKGSEAPAPASPANSGIPR